MKLKTRMNKVLVLAIMMLAICLTLFTPKLVKSKAYADNAFDFSTSTDGWYAGTGTVTMTNEDNALKLDVDGASPIILSSAVELDATNRYMTIEMKNNIDVTGMTMYFTTDTVTAFSGSALVTFSVNQDTDYKNYVIDMGACAEWKGTVTGFRFDLYTGASEQQGTAYIKSISFSDTLPAGDTEFDFTQGGLGWTLNVNAVTVSSDENGLILTKTGNGSFIVSPNALGIDCAQYRYIRITMRSDITTSKMKLYYTTTADMNFDENKTILFDVEKTEDFVTYVIDTTTSFSYTGTLNQIRFDIDNDDAASGTLYLQKIAFVETSEPGYVVGGGSSSGGNEGNEGGGSGDSDDDFVIEDNLPVVYGSGKVVIELNYNKDVNLTINTANKEISSMTCNEKEVSSSNYSLSYGRLTIKSAYVSEISKKTGAYKFTITTEDGSADFTVQVVSEVTATSGTTSGGCGGQLNAGIWVVPVILVIGFVMRKNMIRRKEKEDGQNT